MNISDNNDLNILKESTKEVLSELGNNNSFRIEDYWNLEKLSPEQIRSLNTDLSIAGYFLGFSRKETVNGMKWRIMQFEPLYQEDKTDLIRQYKVAYHWSPSYNKGNILKNGFIPSSSNKMFSYPPRIYFMNGQSTDKELLSIVQGLCRINTDERNSNFYTLFFIGTSEIPENVKFHLDPNMKNGLYTNNSIPNSVIFKAKDYKIF